MRTINRSAITLTFKQEFIDWHNYLYPDLPYKLNTVGQSKTYLINQFFKNPEELLTKYYKEIFEAELEGVHLDENDWPQKRTLKVFNEWFDVKISDWVMDMSKQEY